MIHLALINVPPQKCSPRSFMDTIHGYSPTWASTPLTTLPLRIFCWPHSTSATKISIQRLLQIISTHWRSDRPDGTFCLTVHQTDFSCLITVEEGVHRWAEKYKSNQCDKSFHFVDMFLSVLCNVGFNLGWKEWDWLWLSQSTGTEEVSTVRFYSC